MSEQTQKQSYYVLGWKQPNGKIALLCRSDRGPVLCHNWKESVKTRTSLLNDPRASNNTNAQKIISNLRIYKLNKGETLIWRPGDLWTYMDRKVLELLEEDITQDEE